MGSAAQATDQGSRFVVTIIDWFTRWIEAYAVKDTSTESICEALEKSTLKHGIPRRIVSDNAKYFTAATLKAYEDKLGIKHTFVSAYRPQGNSRLERFHRTLERKMKIQCRDTGHKN